MVYVDPDVRRLLDSVDPAARDFTNLTPAQLRANAELIGGPFRVADVFHRLEELGI